MNITVVAAALALFAIAAGESPKEPADAIALADAHAGQSVSGIFHMSVAAAGHAGSTVFLNSSPDYRAPDDLTFELTGNAVKALRAQLGARSEVALIGRSVTVRGFVEAIAVANIGLGGAMSFNRYQHRVRVFKADQVIVN